MVSVIPVFADQDTNYNMLDLTKHVSINTDISVNVYCIQTLISHSLHGLLNCELGELDLSSYYKIV